MKTGPLEISFLVISIIGSFSVSVWLTAWAKEYSIKHQLLDVPSSRGSHQVVKPRGGGIAIIIPVIIVVFISMLFVGQHYREYGTLILVLIMLASIGWLDDHNDQPVLRRIGVHLLTGAVVLYGIGAIDNLQIDSFQLKLGPLAGLLTIIWVAWMANLYNFMDGIDGLVAGHTVIAGCTIGLWFSFSGDLLIASICYSLMAASLGFLVWNWDPARIFMGDVGSVAVGGLLATLAVLGNQAHNIPILAFILLYLIFLLDTGITLVNRMRRRKILFQAHHEHFYQRAVATGWTHGEVSTVSLLANLILAVLATLVALNIGLAWLWLVISLALVISLIQIVRLAEHAQLKNSHVL